MLLSIRLYQSVCLDEAACRRLRFFRIPAGRVGRFVVELRATSFISLGAYRRSKVFDVGVLGILPDAWYSRRYEKIRVCRSAWLGTCLSRNTGLILQQENRHEAKIERLVSLSPSFSTKKLHPANYSVGLIDDKHGLMLSSKSGSTHQRARGTRVESGPIERKA